jgi:hypothetical protein
MSFQLSPELEENKVFLIDRSELEGRLDPFCYIPELVTLDKEIKSKTNYRLSDFTKFRASGATPSKSHDEYYSDKENGIPFIRVQNLSTTGELDQSNLTYISKDIHNGLLKRSQIKEHDLLVKITGVGRMAVASVAPDGFEGNINQHIVVVRTGSKEISENIASFLNLDAIERIATKRATGGTRPALDYPALFSIPVINDRKFHAKIKIAVAKKKQKEAEAKNLLDSIDDYLLAELGIELPEQEENTVQSRIFTRRLSDLSGGRFDPKLYDNKTISLKKSIKGSTFPKYKLKQLVVESVAGDWGKELDLDIDGFSKCLVIRATEFDNLFNLNLNNKRLKYRLINDKKLLKISVNKNDLLIEKSGGSPDQPVGRIAIITTEVLNKASIIGFSNFIQKIKIDKNQILPSYLFCFLKTIHSIGLTDAMQSQTNGIRNLIMGNYYDQYIPLPPLKKQTEIANHITQTRNKAKQLQRQAKAELEQAKKEVEVMILGEDAKRHNKKIQRTQKDAPLI